MQTAQSLNLADAIEIGYLDIAKTTFFATPGGFLGLKYGEKEYKRVALRRALPIGKPGAFISVADAENKEIGILSDIQELPDAQMKLVIGELDRRYYCPTVREIKSVKDKLGYVYMELSVEGDGRTYDKHCAIKDVNKNIRMLDDNRLILFDVDGNRYMVSSLSALDKKSLKRLEPYLF